MPVQLDEKPTQDLSRKELKALAKARRPWYMKKRFWALGLVGILAAAAAAGGGGDSSDAEPINQGGSAAPAESGSNNDKLFPNRPDSQGEDQERNIGGEVRLSGYTTTVTAAGFQQSVSDFEDSGYIVADVEIFNRDDKAQPYNMFDWSLQTPNGQVVDIDFTTVDTLSSGDLVPGGEVTGKVVFEVGAQKGDFYLIYKPDAFDAARGIWKVTV